LIIQQKSDFRAFDCMEFSSQAGNTLLHHIDSRCVSALTLNKQEVSQAEAQLRIEAISPDNVYLSLHDLDESTIRYSYACKWSNYFDW